jgi:hypothetical protein
MIEERKHSLLSLMLVIIGSVVACSLAIGVVFWTIGVVFHLVSLLFRVAIVVAVAALVWRLVTGRRAS